MSWKKTEASILIFTVCLLPTLGYSQIKPATSETCEFIVYSDTHIGQGIISPVGGDNLTALERYAMLIASANEVKAIGMVDIGDLTAGWYLNNSNQKKMYQDFIRLSMLSNKPVFNVKGNHDCNLSLYTEYFPLVWIAKSNEVLGVGLGSVSQDGVEWLQNYTMYSLAQIEWLKQTIHSQYWNATKFHFLFMHFDPDNSTWAGFRLPEAMLPLYQYFDVVFCGHEGGKQTSFQYMNATVVKTSHLGDGKIMCDTYLKVTLIRGTENFVVVEYVNFVNGETGILLTKKVFFAT